MDISEYLLKNLKKSMDNVVIKESEGISNQIKFVDNKIAKTGTEQLKDIEIFAVKNKKIVSTSFRNITGDNISNGGGIKLSKEKADELIKKLEKFVKFISPKEDYYGIADGKFKYQKIKNSYDKKIKSMNHVKYVEDGINASLKEGAKRASGILESHETQLRILTSDNLDVYEKGTNFYFSLRAFFDKHSSGHYTCCSRMLNKFNVKLAGKKAGEIAVMAKNPIEGVEGKYDVIFDPLPLAGLLSGVASSLSIFNVESGLSFFSNKLNQKVANENVTFIDDALKENGYGSSSFDAEGRSTRKNILIKNGILDTYYHNTSSAKKYNVEPTGNAGLIDPINFNFELIKGKDNRDKLIKNVNKGILITNLWYTRYNNYITGDFSTIPRDGMFLINNGRIVRSLKNLRVSDNMLRILNNIKKVGSNSEQVVSWEAENNITCPSILVKDVNITKAKE